MINLEDMSLHELERLLESNKVALEYLKSHAYGAEEQNSIIEVSSIITQIEDRIKKIDRANMPRIDLSLMSFIKEVVEERFSKNEWKSIKQEAKDRQKKGKIHLEQSITKIFSKKENS